MQNAALRPHPVMVSTVPLAVQLARLEDSLPQVQALLKRTCPQDPRYPMRAEMLAASESAISWLQRALR